MEKSRNRKNEQTAPKCHAHGDGAWNGTEDDRTNPGNQEPVSNDQGVSDLQQGAHEIGQEPIADGDGRDHVVGDVMNKKEDTEKQHQHDKGDPEVRDSAGIEFSKEPTQGKALVDLFHRHGKTLELPDLEKTQVCGYGGIKEISQGGGNGAEAAITSH